MGRLGVTYEDVANAAEVLKREKTQPTVDGVRELLKTGSKSTIAKYLKQWKIGQSSLNFQPQNDIPPELLTAIKTLWAKGNERAEHLAHQVEQQREEIQRSHELLMQMQRNWQLLEEKNKMLEFQITQQSKLKQALEIKYQALHQKNLQLEALVKGGS